MGKGKCFVFFSQKGDLLGASGLVVSYDSYSGFVVDFGFYLALFLLDFLPILDMCHFNPFPTTHCKIDLRPTKVSTPG